MRRLLLSLLIVAAFMPSSPRQARAETLEQILAFYAQGAGSTMEIIAETLTINAANLAKHAPAATRAAMQVGGSVAGGIAEVLSYDPAIREVLKQKAVEYGAGLGLRGAKFNEAMRQFAANARVGTVAQRRAGRMAGRRAGAASLEGLTTVAGLAIITGATAFLIHEYFLAYDAEAQAESVDQEAFSNNVRLLLNSLASQRQSLCAGMTIPDALHAIRKNADSGRFPFLGVLEQCSGDRTATPRLAGSWKGCDGRIVTFTQRGETLTGRYVALGGLGHFGFKVGDIGYEHTRHADGAYVGKVLWKFTDGRSQWKPSTITLQDGALKDTGADGCSASMSRAVAGGQAPPQPPPPPKPAPPACANPPQTSALLHGTMYYIVVRPYGPGDVCLTDGEVGDTRRKPDVTAFESRNTPCVKCATGFWKFPYRGVDACVRCPQGTRYYNDCCN